MLDMPYSAKAIHDAHLVNMPQIDYIINMHQIDYIILLQPASTTLVSCEKVTKIIENNKDMFTTDTLLGLDQHTLHIVSLTI